MSIINHRWDECELCGPVVFCGKCGNNCCNGTYGTLSDGRQCDACPDAYAKQEAEYEQAMERLAAEYIRASGKTVHASDCATSNAPAYKPGPCDCDDGRQPIDELGEARKVMAEEIKRHAMWRAHGAIWDLLCDGWPKTPAEVSQAVCNAIEGGK